VERGGEEARARRWTAGTPAAAIKAGGLGGRPFPGEEEAGRLFGAGRLSSLRTGGKGRRRGEARGHRASGGRRGQEGGAAPGA
jgi:hypothetical protein